MENDLPAEAEPDKPRRLVTVKEACEYGKMGKDTLYQYLNGGAVKAYKRQSTTLVDLNSIDELNASLPPYVPRANQRKKVAGEFAEQVPAAEPLRGRNRRQVSAGVGKRL